MNQTERINIDTFKVITKAMTHSHDLQEIADSMCNLLVETLNIKACAIYLLNIQETELQILANSGLSRAYLLKGPIDPKRSLGSTMKGEAIVISDLTQETRVQYPEQAQKEGIQAIAEVPIKAPEKIIGSFRLYNSARWDISDDDLESLYALGELMGLAINYSSLAYAVQSVHRVLATLPVRMDLE